MLTLEQTTLPPDSAAAENAPHARTRDIKRSRILIVDDEALNIAVVQSYLEMEGYVHIRSTENAGDAMAIVQQYRPDLVLLDIHMPNVNGMEILRAIRADENLATIPVVILTATSTSETKLEALQAGATDLLSKPVHQGELLARIHNVLIVKAYQDRLRGYSEELERAVRKRTAELEASRMEVIQCLARAAEFRDDDTGQHILRVGRYARIIGAELGLPDATLQILESAAQLHDVGKIGVPDAILLKPGKLTPEEFAVMRQHCGFGNEIVDCHPATETKVIRSHTELGSKILDQVRSPILHMAQRIALTHHERWDGDGYPLGLSGEQIPLEGRITAVADVFDALSSKRSYKPEFPLEKCLAILEDGRGTHFDPQVLDAFFARQHEIFQVRIDFADGEV
ncbi:MAG: HD domain-containing phosphohydrolase [Pirellulaceae bacterium]